jgi:hypothetical protein
MSGSATYASSSIMKRISKGQNASWICLMLYKWKQFNLSGSYVFLGRKQNNKLQSQKRGIFRRKLLCKFHDMSLSRK